MGNAFGKLLHEADRWKKKSNLAVLCIQEHNLKPSEEGDIRTQAVLRGYSLAISFGKTDDPNDRQAGVLILTNDKLVSFKKTNVCKPGMVRVTITWGGKEMSVASVYAPVQPLKRVEFFNTTIRRDLTPKTFAGGDWNCVPDVTLDVQSANPLAYHSSNQGASLLDHLMSTKHMLADTRREQLGTCPEHTHSQKVTHGPNSGTYTNTRIDRWYNMDDPTLLYSFETINNFIYKQHNSDHHGVLMLISDRSGEMGKERTTLRADLMEIRAILPRRERTIDGRPHTGLR